MLNNLSLVLNQFKEKNYNLEYIRQLKTGKEAEVHLVKMDSLLLALKIYKVNQKYSSRFEYLDLNVMKDTPTTRAMRKKTRKGKMFTRSFWTYREYSILKKLNEYNLQVPKVYDFIEDAILMEFLGEESAPALRLVDLNLSKSQLKKAYLDTLEFLRALTKLGYVHGDFSEYNILWWENSAYAIDFPQMLDFKNPFASEKLQKDLDNIYKFFSKFIDIDYKELLEIKDNFMHGTTPLSLTRHVPFN